MIGLATREAHVVSRLLEEGAVPRDGVLFVHCAFRGLGEQGLAVEPFIEALLAYMDRGTLIMPTMTWRVVTPDRPVFDELGTVSHVGLLAETFRLRYASHRSLHPTHSVAAYGRLAGDLTAGHHLDDTPCSMESPYGRARREEAYVLMVGVGLERCTAVHHAEELVAPDVYLEPPANAQIYSCRDRHGVTHSVRLRRHIKLNRDFPQFTAPLVEKGQMAQPDIGGTPCLLFSQRDLLDEVIGALERDPRAIIAPPGAPIIP